MKRIPQLPMNESMKKLVREIIDSYEARVTAVGKIIDTTHELIETYREKRFELSAELKDKLARSESLRRKDFDRMMQEVYRSREEKEKQVKQLLKNFLRERSEMAEQLKTLLEDIEHKGVIAKASKIEDFRMSFSEIKARHEDREREVTQMLRGFHREQESLSRELKNLLAKGESVRIKDVKSMLGNFPKHNHSMKESEGGINRNDDKIIEGKRV